MNKQVLEKYSTLFPQLEAVHEALINNRTRLPYIVEVTGMPKAGKTQLLKRLKRALSDLGLSVGFSIEAATDKVSSRFRDDLFSFNVLCLLENLSNVLKFSECLGDLDIALLDRGLVDSMVWCEFLSRSGLMNEATKRSIEEFILVGSWFSQTHLTVFMNNDWATYQRRFRNESLLPQEFRFNEDYFRRLHDSYEQVINSLPGDRPPKLMRIDCSLPQALVDSGSPGDVFDATLTHLNDQTTQLIGAILDGLVEQDQEYIAVVPAKDVVTGVIELRGPVLVDFIDRIFGRGKNANLYDRAPDPIVSFRLRDEVEHDDGYVQLVASAFLRRRKQLLVLRRSKEEKRESLRGKRTLLVGGHVERDDRYLSRGGRNEVENCLLRELREELTRYDRPTLNARFAVHFGDAVMGMRHMGLIYEIETNSTRIETRSLPGAGPFDPHPEFFEFREIVRLRDEFDPWSIAIIDRLQAEESAG